MPQTRDFPDWRQFLEAGMQFTAVTRTEAQRRARQLVREGQLAQGRMQAFIDELVRTSRQRADDLVEIVRTEIQRQVEALGIATKRDLERLEARIRKAEKASKQTAKAARTAAKDAATRRPSRAS